MLILWHTGSPNPFVSIPYDVLVTMGRSEDFPAKVEQHGDLPNFDRLRARAMATREPSQLLATLEGGRTSWAAVGISGIRGWSAPAPASAARGDTLDSREYPSLSGDSSRERMETESDPNASTTTSSETVNTAPAYANWMLLQFKQFIVDVVEGITEVDNMILLYRILRHSQQERNAAAEAQELVLQIRLRVRANMVTRADSLLKVAAIQARMGIDQPPHRAGWLLRGNPVEVLTRAASRNDPLHNVFHCPRGDFFPFHR
jgi:hypothetical protein